MTNEEIKNTIQAAVNGVAIELQRQFQELQSTKEPPTFEQQMEYSVKQFIEDKQTDRYGGKDIEYKPTGTITGAGKEV
jgi:hypothetical protein